MSSTNKTTYYELPQFVDSDLFNPLVDDNDAYDKIDTALHNIAEAEAGDASEIVGVKNRVTTAEGKITALETQNGVEALTTTAQTLSGAVNELDADVASLDNRVDVVDDDINNANTGLKVKVVDLGTRMTTAEVKIDVLERQNGVEALTTTAQTLSGAVNELDSDILSINTKLGRFLNPKDFGATCDKDVDDSQPMQNLFDYALANSISHISFAGISEISFKNVEIKSSVVIDCGVCKFYGVAGVEERVYTMFTANDPDIDVVIDGGEFIGKGGDTYTYNPTEVPNPPLFDVTFAKSFVIKNGYYHNFNNSHEGVTATTPLVDRFGVLFRIHDCKFTSIEHNIFDKVHGSELMYIIGVTYDREEVNGEFKNNIFSHTDTSAIDFLGNNVEVCGNIYNYSYDGSTVNAYGLNVYIHDESINGQFRNCYDATESQFFQSNNIVVENIKITETRFAVRSASRNTRVSNIFITRSRDTHVTYLVDLQPGYGADSNIHPYVGVTELPSCDVLIENCDMQHLDGGVGFYIGIYTDQLKPLVNIKNCIAPIVTSETQVDPLIDGKNADIKISNCVLYTRLTTGFSSTRRVAIFNNTTSDAHAHSITLINNIIIDTDTTHDCYVCGGYADSDVIIANNIGYCPSTMYQFPTTFTSAIGANNINIAVAS